MTYFKFMRKACWAAATLLVAPVMALAACGGCGVYSPAIASKTVEYSNEASSLLQQMKTKAIQVRYLADQLGAFERDGSVMDWRVDAGVLMRAKAQVNAMDGMLFRLRAMGQDVLPWQQQAIDRVAPKMVELTDYIQLAMQNLNAHHGTAHLVDKSYTLETGFMYQRANLIARSIGQFEKYASAKNEMRLLGPQLGMKVAS